MQQFKDEILKNMYIKKTEEKQNEKYTFEDKHTEITKAKLQSNYIYIL